MTLNIDSQNELANARFFNVVGALVLEVEMNGVLTKEVNVSELDNGLYILQVRDVKGGMTSMKFLKH